MVQPRVTSTRSVVFSVRLSVPDGRSQERSQLGGRIVDTTVSLIAAEKEAFEFLRGEVRINLWVGEQERLRILPGK